MLSNLEQAITNVLAANRPPNYINVLEAYVKIAGRSKVKRDIPFYFDRAIEKYPDAKEKLQSPFAPLVQEIRKQHWHSTIDTAVKLFGDEILFPCPCNCGAMLTIDDFRRELDLEDEAIQPPVNRKKPKKLKYRRTNNKGGMTVKTVAFDPYGPSTSWASM